MVARGRYTQSGHSFVRGAARPRDPRPGEHAVDGYTSADLLLAARTRGNGSDRSRSHPLFQARTS